MGRKTARQGAATALPDELWAKVLESVPDDSVFAFASACTQLRRVQRESGRRLVTRIGRPGESKEATEGCVEWWSSTMRSRDRRARSAVVNLAASRGHLGVLKFWRRRTRGRRDDRPVFDSRTAAVAARHGRLETLQWLAARDEVDIDENTCAMAALGNHWKVLRFLRAREGVRWNEETCSGAAEGGHLDLLRWLRAEGCPWDQWTAYEAVLGGHLRVLRFLKRGGCPWSEDTLVAAAAFSGQVEVLQWLTAGGRSRALLREDVFALAARGGRLGVLRWLRSVGCPRDDEACERHAAENAQAEALRWLRETRDTAGARPSGGAVVGSGTVPAVSWE